MYAYIYIYIYICMVQTSYLRQVRLLRSTLDQSTLGQARLILRALHLVNRGGYEQALVSLKLKKSVDAEGGRTLAVIIEGG